MVIEDLQAITKPLVVALGNTMKSGDLTAIEVAVSIYVVNYVHVSICKFMRWGINSISLELIPVR